MTPTKITAATPPQFAIGTRRCWLWDSSTTPPRWCRRADFQWAPKIQVWYTHWHPDQPTAPPSSPGETTEQAKIVREMDELGIGISRDPLQPAQSQTPMTDAVLFGRLCYIKPENDMKVMYEHAESLETALAAAKERGDKNASLYFEAKQVEIPALIRDRDALAEKLRRCAGDLSATLNTLDNVNTRADALRTQLRELEERWAVREETLTRVLGERDDLRTRLAALQQTVKGAVVLLSEIEDRFCKAESSYEVSSDEDWLIKEVAEFKYRLARQPDQRQGEGVKPKQND